ncbi:MAG: hypothetical protein ACK4OP_09090 [Gemmobacter sp.]
MVEDPAVHVAETGRTPRPLRLGRLPRLADAPVVADLVVRLAPDARAHLAWRPAAGATHYEIEVAEGGPAQTAEIGWTRAGETAAGAVVLRPPYGPRTRFRVRAIGRSAGPWATIQAPVPRPALPTGPDPAPDLVWSRRSDTVWTTRADTVWTYIGDPP